MLQTSLIKEGCNPYSALVSKTNAEPYLELIPFRHINYSKILFYSQFGNRILAHSYPSKRLRKINFCHYSWFVWVITYSIQIKKCALNIQHTIWSILIDITLILLIITLMILLYFPKIRNIRHLYFC